MPPPVIAVEVVQPAAFLHQLDGPWGVEPRGVAMQPLVLFTLAALKAALVGPLRAPVIIVVHTFPGLCFTQTVPWDRQKASVRSQCNEMHRSGGKADIWRHQEPSLTSRASIINLAKGQAEELCVVKRSSSRLENGIKVQCNSIHYQSFLENNN